MNIKVKCTLTPCNLNSLTSDVTVSKVRSFRNKFLKLKKTVTNFKYFETMKFDESFKNLLGLQRC